MPRIANVRKDNGQHLTPRVIRGGRHFPTDPIGVVENQHGWIVLDDLTPHRGGRRAEALQVLPIHLYPYIREFGHLALLRG